MINKYIKFWSFKLLFIIIWFSIPKLTSSTGFYYFFLVDMSKPFYPWYVRILRLSAFICLSLCPRNYVCACVCGFVWVCLCMCECVGVYVCVFFADYEYWHHMALCECVFNHLLWNNYCLPLIHLPFGSCADRGQNNVISPGHTPSCVMLEG